MHWWWNVLMLCLQRMMKLVSWMACWRRCSPALLSRENEVHGKQVLGHKQNTKSSWNMSQRTHILLVLEFSFMHWNTREAHCFHHYFSVSVSVDTQQLICLCSPLLFHLLHGSETVGCGSILWPWLQWTKPIPANEVKTTNEERGCGVGSREQLVGCGCGIRKSNN